MTEYEATKQQIDMLQASLEAQGKQGVPEEIVEVGKKQIINLIEELKLALSRLAEKD